MRKPWQKVIDGDERFVIVHGECEKLLPHFTPLSVDVCLTDPPYDAKTHDSARRTRELPDTAEHECRNRRKIEIGFEPLSPQVQQTVAIALGKIVKRWSGAFCTVEMVHGWKEVLEDGGSEYVRTGFWHRIGATPQITGDRPGTCVECIVFAHQTRPDGKPMKKRWNGRGTHGLWAYKTEIPRLGRGEKRLHETQKPIDLMLKLVELFTDPDEVVLDPFSGSGTTGVACMRLGRRYIGIEKRKTDVVTSRARLQAELEYSTLTARRQGQVGLFE